MDDNSFLFKNRYAEQERQQQSDQICKQAVSSAGKTPTQSKKADFMSHNFENPMIKRENFAVQLRKEKTQAILSKKRKKIKEYYDSAIKLPVQSEEQINRQSTENANCFSMNLIDIFQSYRGYPEWKSKDKSKDKMDPAAGDQNSSIGDGEDSHLFNVLNARVRDFGELRNQGEIQQINAILPELQRSIESNDQLACLACITYIRTLLSKNSFDVDMDEVIEQTDIIVCLNVMVKRWITVAKPGFYEQMDNNNQKDHILLRYQALEVNWILANLSYSDNAAELILDPKFKFQQFIDHTLDGLDYFMIENCLYLLTNIMQTSHQLKKACIKRFKILDCIQNMIVARNFPSFLVEHAIKIIKLITDLANCLTKDQVLQISHISNYQINNIEHLQIELEWLKKEEGKNQRENDSLMNYNIRLDHNNFMIHTDSHDHPRQSPVQQQLERFNERIFQIKHLLIRVLNQLAQIDDSRAPFHTFIDFISEDGEKTILRFICQKLKELCYDDDLNRDGVELALGFIGQVSSVDNPEILQYLVDQDIFESINNCIENYTLSNPAIQAKALWTASNLVICPGDPKTEQQMVKLLLDNSTIGYRMCKLACQSNNLTMVTEALWAIVNLIHSSNDSQLKEFYESNSAINDPEKNFVLDEETNTLMYDSCTEAQQDEDFTNNLIKALIKGINLQKDQQLIHYILQSIKKLIDMDDIFGLTDYQGDADEYRDSLKSVLEQLRICELEPALHACQLNFAADDLDAADNDEDSADKSMFMVCNDLFVVMKVHKEKMVECQHESAAAQLYDQDLSEPAQLVNNGSQNAQDQQDFII